MTTDEQAVFVELMQNNGFELINSNVKELDFLKTENDESFQVTLLTDFPYYVRSKYAHGDIPDKWAMKAVTLKGFDRVKAFAESGVNEMFENLKQDFDRQLRGS